MKCLKCQSGRIVIGSIQRGGFAIGYPVIKPKALRFWKWPPMDGFSLRGDAFACRDCGLIWTDGRAAALDEFVNKHCERT